MNTERFDAVTRLFAARRTRRAALGSGIGFAAATVAPRATRVLAQEATPAGTPEVMTSTDPHPSADALAKTEYLFVQPFAGGTWTPKPGEDGIFTLTLTGASAQTVYFSDRPEREFGLLPTKDFLDNLGFTPADPPNAALVARTDGGKEEVLVVELLNPAYDEAAGTLTYDARLLTDYEGTGLAHAAQAQTDYALPESFVQGGLFIDGCSDYYGYCYKVVNGQEMKVGDILVPTCGALCDLCGHSTDPHYGKLCAETFPDQCSFRPAYDANGQYVGSQWDCFAEMGFY